MFVSVSKQSNFGVQVESRPYLSADRHCDRGRPARKKGLENITADLAVQSTDAVDLREFQEYLGAPLVTLKDRSLPLRMVASVRLPSGSKDTNLTCPYVFRWA